MEELTVNEINKSLGVTISKAGKEHYWTLEAGMCYRRGYNCRGCFYTDFFDDSDHTCQMKYVVMELVNKYGVPRQFKNRRMVV